MSQFDYYGKKIPTKPLPDLVVRTTFFTSLFLILGFIIFMLLTGFTRVISLPKEVSAHQDQLPLPLARKVDRKLQTRAMKEKPDRKGCSAPF